MRRVIDRQMGFRHRRPRRANDPGRGGGTGLRRRLSRSIVWGIILLVLAAPEELFGAEQMPSVPDATAVPSASASPEVRFLRVYAPADRIEQWPWGEMKYVPVEGAEFERLIRLMEESASVRPIRAGIREAKYTARFSESSFLEGEATFRIHHQGPEPTALRWPTWRLAVRDAAWLGADGKPAKSALLGLSETGQTELFVSESGQLRLNWSFQAEREVSGAIRFDLRLPPCPHTELVLDVPDSFRPVLQEVFLQELAPAPSPGRKTWRFEWGGQMPGPLRLIPQESSTEHAPLLLVQQQAQYTLRQEGLEGEVQWNIQALSESVSEASFLVDAGLEIVRVKLAGQEVSWRMDSSAQPGPRRLWISLPQPLSRAVQLLQIELIGPVVFETAWAIPRIRMEGTVWQQGTFGLRILHPLVLQKLVFVGCRQSKSQSLAAAGANVPEEYVEFQEYSPQASLQIVLGRRHPQLQADTGCVVMLSDRQMNCRVRARLRTDVGEHFVLQAQVARRWLIDAVEADPSTQVEDWTLEPNNTAGQRLTIRLSRPVTAQRPVNLLITGRRLQSPVGRTWRTEDLVPVRFEGSQAAKRLAALCPADASYELVCLNADTTLPLNPRQLDPADWELVEKTAEGFLFWDTPQTESLQWVLRVRPPRYRTKIHLDVLASQKSLVERYRIECTPEGARVERLVLVFSQARPEPIRWTISGDLQRQWTARRLTEKDLPADGVPAGGEAWEMLLRPSRSGTFEILGQRSSALGAETPVSLLGVPQAASQEAVVCIRTVGPESPQIVSQRIQPIPSAWEAFTPGWTARLAAFRYDPNQELTGQKPPALLLRPCQGPTAAEETWAWHARLESRFQPDGQALHWAAYGLVHFRRTQLSLRFPSESHATQIEGVWLNGQQARWNIQKPTQEGVGPSVLVELPPERTFSMLVIGFRTQEKPLRHGQKLQPVFPQLDMPVATRSWTFWLPPGFEALCPPGDNEKGYSGGISIPERLFGIWARPEHRQPFDPFNPGHWKTLYDADPLVYQCQEQVETFFQTLGAFLAEPSLPPAPSDSSQKSASSARRWTWGEILQQEAFSRAGKILIDRQGVWEAGIDPSSLVYISSPLAQGREQRAGREALWQAGLALEVYPGILLITSWERAARWKTSGQNLGDPLAWYLPTGELLRQMEQAANLKLDPAFVGPDVWQESAEPSPAVGMRPWDGTPHNAMLGWSAYRIEVPESAISGPPVQIEILAHEQMEGWYWAAFFPAAGIGLLLIRRSLAATIAAAGLLGAGALVIPENAASVGAGAFSGMLLALAGGVLWGSIRTEDAKIPPSESQPALLHTGSAQGIISSILLLAFGLLPCTSAFGAESPAVAPPPSAAPLYRVFIPITEKEQPTGDPYQVPEPFYQYLRRRTQSSLPTASRWQIGQALYRGELTWNSMANQWEIPRLNVVWQWEVKGKLAQVRLPMAREKFVLIPGTWTVEGQPIEPQWNEEGTLLVFAVPASAPTVRIEGQIRPPALQQGDLQGVDLAIPPVPEARLELLLPSEAPEISLSGALGIVKRLPNPTPRLAAELGPTEQVSLRWPSGGRPSGPTASPEVEQLLWLRLQPGAVLLDVRFRVRFPQSSLGPARLRVMAENRLHLLRGQQGEENKKIEIHSAPGGQIIQFSLPISGQNPEGVVGARFLLSEIPGLGNVRLPKLEPLEVRVQKRWLAVSVDSSLEYPEPSPNRPELVPVEEFLNLWGDADLPPQWVENLPVSGSAWSLATRPRIPNTSAEQTLALGYGEKTIRVWYEARLTTTSGASFQHRLQAPQDLQIETVAILQDNTPLPVRWERSPEGKWTLFSQSPLRGRYELRIAGLLPNTLSQRRPLPYVEIEGAETEWAVLELFRQPEVLLRLAKSEGLNEIAPPQPSEAKAHLGRPFQSFAVDPRQIAEAEIQVLPNRPLCKVQQITLLRPPIEQWEAEVDLQLHVERGWVDEILLEAPPCWPGPYKTSPQVNLSIKELSEGRRSVVLRPALPITESYRLRITGPIHWPKTDPLEVPKILLQNFPESEHLLLLPTQFQLHPMVWETQGLEKTEIPKEAMPESIGQETWEAYRIVSPQFTARLQTLAEQPQRPEVRLADIYLHWQPDGLCSGKAWFYLLPAGQDRCVVCLPNAFRLLHLQLEDNPAPLILEHQSDRYTVLLASSVLPQVLQVHFLGGLPPGVLEGLQPFPAPRIENWPLVTSLWTIAPPAGYELAEPEGVGRVSPLQLDAYRLRTIGGLLETGCRQPPESKEDFLRWYPVWRRRFSALLGQVHRQLALPPTTEFHRTLRVEAQALQLKLGQLAENLRLPDIPPADSSGPLSTADVPGIGLNWLETPQQICRAVVHGPSEGIALTYLPKTRYGILLRLLLAAALAGALGTLAWIVPKADRLALLAPWTHVGAVLAGGIWWLWLWPSALGWLIILGALLPAFWKGFRLARTFRRL